MIIKIELSEREIDKLKKIQKFEHEQKSKNPYMKIEPFVKNKIYDLLNEEFEKYGL